MEKIFLDYLRTVAFSGGVKADSKSLDSKRRKYFIEEGFVIEGGIICWHKPTHSYGKAYEYNLLAFQAWKKSFRQLFYEIALHGEYECTPLLSLFSNGRHLFEQDGFTLTVSKGHIISYSWRDAEKGDAGMLRRLTEKSEKIDKF